jgi:hypothetical protein
MICAVIVAETKEKLFEAADDIKPKIMIVEESISEFSDLRLITSPAMSVIGSFDTGKSGCVALAMLK